MPPYGARKIGQARILDARRCRERYLVDLTRGREIAQRSHPAVRVRRLDVTMIHIVAPLIPAGSRRSLSLTSSPGRRQTANQSYRSRPEEPRPACRFGKCRQPPDDSQPSASARMILSLMGEFRKLSAYLGKKSLVAPRLTVNNILPAFLGEAA